MIVVLTGGVGGSKLASGLYRRVGEHLTAVANTADDVQMHGLHVSPDLDTLMYTLAGVANEVTGWGVQGDTFHAMEMLDRYGQETWFRLGDRDLATHLVRTEFLTGGMSLTEATRALSHMLGVGAAILPMCDEPVATMVETPAGEVPFQEYFVHRRTVDQVVGVRFDGIERATVSEAVSRALDEAEAIILSPSNPIVSIGPILAVPGLRDALKAAPGRRVAVSPIVGSSPVSGPAGRMMKAAGVDVSVHGLAELYKDFLDALVIDSTDAGEAAALRSRGLEVLATDIVMKDLDDRVRLAGEVLSLATGRAG